ncbi:MAG TPA: hypothetical protein PKA64_16835, partial [Myxococcota bacterium]|nr:hypothetical protein [Myxococcota bacterium]
RPCAAPARCRFARRRGGSVSGNRSTSLAGGGVCATGAVIAGLDVLDNRSDNGAGGIDGADLTLSDLVIRGNRAALSGGGVFVSGAASFTDVVLDGNQADIEGGGIYLPFDRSELTLTRCAVSANHADFFAAIAGGVWLDGGRLISVDTSWGGAGTDNRPADVGLSRSHQTFGRQGVASFVCDDATGACQ